MHQSLVTTMYRVIIRPLLWLARGMCVTTFALFCLVTLLQVVNRYALGLQIFWTEEVAICLFVWSVMIGIPVALFDRQEIAVDLFSLADGKVKDWLRGSADLVSITFLVLLAVAGGMLINRAGHALTPVLGVPRWWSYLSIPVGSMLGIVVLVARHLVPPEIISSDLDSQDADYAHD